MNFSLFLIFITTVLLSVFGTNKADDDDEEMEFRSYLRLTEHYKTFGLSLIDGLLNTEDPRVTEIRRINRSLGTNYYDVNTVKKFKLASLAILLQIQFKTYLFPSPNLYPVWIAGAQTVHGAITTLCRNINEDPDINEKYKRGGIINYDALFSFYSLTKNIDIIGANRIDSATVRELNVFIKEICPSDLEGSMRLNKVLEQWQTQLKREAQSAASTSQPAA